MHASILDNILGHIKSWHLLLFFLVKETSFRVFQRAYQNIFYSYVHKKLNWWYKSLITCSHKHVTQSQCLCKQWWMISTTYVKYRRKYFQKPLPLPFDSFETFNKGHFHLIVNINTKWKVTIKGRKMDSLNYRKWFGNIKRLHKKEHLRVD